MSALRRAWMMNEARLQSAFWRFAAGATGVAVRHPFLMRALPVGLLAMAAFAVGRAAGLLLTTSFR